MKRIHTVLQYGLLAGFIFFLTLTILDVLNRRVNVLGLTHPIPKYNGKEDFDPSLSRLNTLNALTAYSDSVYQHEIALHPEKKLDEKTYPHIVAKMIRSRFFHGYSSYSSGDNFMAPLLESFTGKWMSAIVIPEDIVRHPYAACSQQSIVMMELLKRKGFRTRKITFINGKKFGHFAFEVEYNGSWHFHDPNLEPDRVLLDSRNNPSVATLASDKALLVAAYRNMPSQQILNIFAKYSYGKPNVFPAPRALVYQKATKILSYFTWVLFFLGYLFVRKRNRRKFHQLHYVRNNGIHFPGFKRKRSTTYYPKVSSSRA